jgi:hypothetical protein
MMKTLIVVAAVSLLTACGSTRPAGTTSTAAVPARGALSISVVPNPIVARPAGSDLYDFPFELVARETGGRDVRIDRVSLDVYALGTIRVYSESYDRARINALGFPTSIAAGSEARYRLAPRKSADERMFGGVSGELSVEGTDDAGRPVSARTTVTVTR